MGLHFLSVGLGLLCGYPAHSDMIKFPAQHCVSMQGQQYGQAVCLQALQADNADRREPCR